MNHKRFPGFARCIEMMQSKNPQTMEDGFHFLLPYASEYAEELIAAYQQPCFDKGMKCWLLELIGSAKSPNAFELLKEAMFSTDPALSYWGKEGLKQLNTKKARQLLWECGENNNFE